MYSCHVFDNPELILAIYTEVLHVFVNETNLSKNCQKDRNVE